MKKPTRKKRAAAAVVVDDRYRKIAGIALLAVAGYLFVAFVSYLFTWKVDQDAALDYGWGLLFAENVAVANWLGPLGASVSHTAFYYGFGATSFLFVYLLGLTGLAVLKRRPLVKLQRQLRWGLVGLMGLSIMLAFAFQMIDFPMGGAYGYLVSSWLEAVIGVPGVLLTFVLAIVVLVVWLFDPQLDDLAPGRLLDRAEFKVALPGGVTDLLGRVGRGRDEDAQAGDTEKKRRPRSAPREERDAGGRLLPGGAISLDDDDDDADVRTPAHPRRRPTGRLTADDLTLDIDYGPSAEEAARPSAPARPPSATRPGAVAPPRPPAAPAAPATPTDEPAALPPVDFAPLDLTAPQGELPLGDPALVTEGGIELDLTANPPSEPAVGQVPDEFHLTAGTTPRDILAAEKDDEVTEAEEDLGPYDPKLELRDYEYPEVELLKDYPDNDHPVTKDELHENKRQIVDVLLSFGVEIQGISATVGPTITLYEIVPASGVRISKISKLSSDIALNLAALGIRIIAPIPGRGSIGIEVPNKNRQMVPLRDVLNSARYREAEMQLPIALGKTISNEVMVVDLAKMPHLLVAGATGQGKSVGINTIIMSLLYRKHPTEVKLVMVDPKKVELSLYSRLERHFLTYMPGQEESIITENAKVIHTLNSLCIEMDERYELLKEAKVRHVTEYNAKFAERRLAPTEKHRHRYLPYIVMIIDEFADLIMTAGKEVELPIARIAQLARAVGMHLIIATQRPTVKIITGTIKANFPARLAFKVTSSIDSKTILDGPGAEQLVGMGDMLLSMGAENARIQCAFVDTPEVNRVLEFIESQQGLYEPYLLPEYVGEDEEPADNTVLRPADVDELFREAAHMVVDNHIGSTSMLQRRMKIGYNRAGRIMDNLCKLGVVGESRGSKPREVMVRDILELESMLDLFFGGE